MPNDLTFTLTSDLTAVPLQNVTLTVAPSSNFQATSYLYQWRAGASSIDGATNSSYKFDASATTTYSCAVTGLTAGPSGNVFVYAKTSGNVIVTVNADTSIFARHLPRGANQLNESGYERFMRIRNLGYC